MNRHYNRIESYIFEDKSESLSSFFPRSNLFGDEQMISILNSYFENLLVPVTVRVRKSYVSPLDQLLQKLDENVQSLIKEFDDEYRRLYYFLQIKNTLQKLSKLAQEEAGLPFARITVMLYDAVRKAKAEDLDDQHVDAIVKVTQMLLKKNIKPSDVITVDKLLYESDLDWIMGDE